MSGQSNHSFGTRLGAWLRDRVYSAHRVTYTKVQALPTTADRTSSCPKSPPSCPQPNELIWHKPIGSTSAMSLTSVADVQLRGNSSWISPQGPKPAPVKDRLLKLEQNSGGTAETPPSFWSLFRRGKRRTAKVAPCPLLEQTNTQSPSMKVKCQDLLDDESGRLRVVDEARPERDKGPSQRFEGLEESSEFGGKTASIRRDSTVFEMMRDKSEVSGGRMAGVDLSSKIEMKRLKQDGGGRHILQASRSSVKGNLPVVDIDSSGKNVIPLDVGVAHDKSTHITGTHGSPNKTGEGKREMRYKKSQPKGERAVTRLTQSESRKRFGFSVKTENRADRKRPTISRGKNKIQSNTACSTILQLRPPRNESRRCVATKKLLRVKSEVTRGRFGFKGGCKGVDQATLDRPATSSNSKIPEENLSKPQTKGARKSLLRVRKRMSKIPVSTWRVRRDGHFGKKTHKHVTFSASCLAFEKEKELSLAREKELFRYLMNLHYARAKKQAMKNSNRIKTTGGGGAAKHCAVKRNVKSMVSDERLLQKRKQDLERKKEIARAKWRRKSEPEILTAKDHTCQAKVPDDETVTSFVESFESELTTKVLKREELGPVTKYTPSRRGKSCSNPCESETIQWEKNSDEEFVYLEALMKQEAMQEEQWELAAQGEWSYICHDDDDEEEETEVYLSRSEGEKELMVERNLHSIIRQFREVGALNDLVRMSELPGSPRERVKRAILKYARICRGPVPLTIMGQEKAEAVSALSTNLYRETRRYFRRGIPPFDDLNQVFDELDLLRERQDKLEDYLRAESLARNKNELPRTRRRKVNPRQPLWELNAGLMLIYETKVKSSTLIDVMETIPEEDKDVLVTPARECARETLINDAKTSPSFGAGGRGLN